MINECQVARLNVASARARDSAWIGGHLLTCLPFACAVRTTSRDSGTGDRRSGSSRMAGSSGRRNTDAGSRQSEDTEEIAVRLRRLRCDSTPDQHLVQMQLVIQ